MDNQLRKDFEEFKVSVFIVVLLLSFMIISWQGISAYLLTRTLSCETDHAEKD